ncbi:MAG: AraC family transcriptional regulator [Nocardioides sp.]
MGSLIRATNVRGFSELVTELGGDPAALLQRFHLPPDVEAHDDSFVPFESVVRLLEASSAELACPDFGLRLSRWQGLDILGPIAVIARNAQTVLDGLAAMARYLYVHSPALTLQVVPAASDDTVRFSFEFTELSLPRLGQSFELSMANGARIVRLLGGTTAKITTIAFLHERVAPLEAYAHELACPVQFGQSWCGFEIPSLLASRPIDSADPETRKIATHYLESAYLPADASLEHRVADLVRRLLATGHCTTEVIADQLAMHPRTLQRRLAEESVRCQDVIDRERRLLAGKYLAQPGLHLNQVAGLLGYAEQSSLNRSCQRWFGATPREVRRSR